MRLTDPSAPVAVIDVGTNTLRLVVGRVVEGRVVRVASARSVTRLGRDLLSTSRLDREAIARSITCLASFKAQSDACGASEVIAVGTSALREARNSAEFLNEAFRKTGISVRVIPGEEEADLTLRGIRGGLPAEPLPAGGGELILDVGGGSTEWVFCKEVCGSGSLPLGAVKMSEQFLLHDPPHTEEITAMKRAVSECLLASPLNSHLKGIEESGRVKTHGVRLIATGGTATTVAAIDMELERYDSERVHLHRVGVQRLRDMCGNLAALPLGERRQVRGCDAGRADIIVGGAAILLTVMEQYGCREVIVSDFGLLEGLLLTHAYGTMN